MFNWLRKLLVAEERIETPDGETYVRHWPVSEKKPRPSGRWRRIGRRRDRQKAEALIRGMEQRVDELERRSKQKKTGDE